LNLPDNHYDIISIHLVLHDIEEESREPALRELYEKLKHNGRIYVREPVDESHGMPGKEIIELMHRAGLSHEKILEERAYFMNVFTGIFVK